MKSAKLMLFESYGEKEISKYITNEPVVMENNFAESVITEAYRFVGLERECLYIVAVEGKKYFARIVERELSRTDDGKAHFVSDAVVYFALKRTFKEDWDYVHTIKVTAKEACNGDVEIHKASDICDFSKLDDLPSAYDMNAKGELVCRCCGAVLKRNKNGKEEN